ncbi:MAG: proton-conducting transporter transmembrane domain-containing protein [Planctomycetota bacterium]|jgi:multicomponent Na+:H+ antiporter subunit D
MSLLLTSPLLCVLAGAILTLACRHRPRLQATIGLSTTISATACGCALAMVCAEQGLVISAIGGWAAPFGIVLVADLAAAALVCVCALVASAVLACRQAGLGSSHTGSSLATAPWAFQPLAQLLLLGVFGAFLTGDLFNLFVWFEVLLLASFSLLALESPRRSLRGTLSYVVLTLLASALFLIGLGLLYRACGSLTMATVASAARSPGRDIAIALLATAFAVKAGIFPVFAWLPSCYHTPSPATSALFAGLLTKVGVYALLRLSTLLAPDDTLRHILLILGIASMITGVAGAVVQCHIRRILSFHIISQVGYMVAAIGLGTPAAIASCLFYLIHHIIVKSTLFLVAGLVAGANDDHLDRVCARSPLLALTFLLPALSLAGAPPLSGFIAKLAVLRASADASHWLLFAAILIVALFTLYSMSKIYLAVFAGSATKPTTTPTLAAILPCLLLAMISLGLGLGAGLVYPLCQQAAATLLDHGAYCASVTATNSVETWP